MTVTPQGNIYICKTPLESDYKNQLTFANTQKQQEYFNSVINYTFSNYTYIKKDSTIKVNESIDNIINCNYLFYRNNGFTDKIYYCFITDIQYINENCTLIRFETDVFQTWYFQINYKQCFVEREHVNDDTVGLHTVPENLETGDYIIDKKFSLPLFTKGYRPCFAVSELPFTSQTDPPTFEKYGGIFSGVAYIVGDESESGTTGSSNIIRSYDKQGKGDAIQSVFMIPNEFCENLNYNLGPGGFDWLLKYAQIPSTNGTYGFSTKSYNKPTSLNGYVPKNKKLLTFPYCYLNVDNNNGNAFDFHYEDFNGTGYAFNFEAVISPGCSMKITPSNYKKVDDNTMYSMTLGKLPICSWSSDSYVNWLTQQSVNRALTLATTPFSLAKGISGKNVDLSGINAITNLVSEAYQRDKVPFQAKGNINSGDVNFALNLINPICYEYSVREEFAKIIDDYFTMFGYKINRIKIPNVTGRKNFNFIKTIDCNFDGNIPQTDLQVIRSIFNNGVTLWHNVNNMYNYSVDNSII